MDNSKLVSNIEKICLIKGISVNKALTESKIGKDFIYNLKNGSKPNTDKVLNLANYFDVSVDYLLGNTDIKNKPTENGEPVDERARAVLERLAKLNDDNYELALAQLDFLLSRQEKTNK
jgi:transcriptional regulator with XRE-family HTH domain